MDSNRVHEEELVSKPLKGPLKKKKRGNETDRGMKKKSNTRQKRIVPFPFVSPFFSSLLPCISSSLLESEGEGVIGSVAAPREDEK